MSGVWAAVPVKKLEGAKQRLAGLLTAEQRQALAAAMLQDVLSAIAQSRVAGILVNTVDDQAARIARQFGARVVAEDACAGHTGAVTGMARILVGEGRRAMLTLPGDIPRITPAEIDAVIASRADDLAFVIAPARDELGSNAVLCSPPDVLRLRFGDDSYFPHLQTARRNGIEPAIVHLPGIGLDIDHPADLRDLMTARPRIPNRTMALLNSMGL